MTVVRILTISSLACVCALSTVGCGTEPGVATSAEGGRLAVDDLRSLVTVSPDATGWSWPAGARTRTMSPPVQLDDSEPSYAIQKAVADAYEAAGLVTSTTSSWWDTANGRKASSFANLVATPDDATTALKADREFARHWFPEFERQEIREIDADGIGETSWAVQGGGDEAGFVEIGWTRGNATLAVYVSCRPCPSDVADAARRWARAIDDAAIAAAG